MQLLNEYGRQPKNWKRTIKTLFINPFEDLSNGTIKFGACVGFSNRRNLWNEIWSLDMYKEVMLRIELRYRKGSVSKFSGLPEMQCRWHGDSGENLLTNTYKNSSHTLHYLSMDRGKRN